MNIRAATAHEIEIAEYWRESCPTPLDHIPPSDLEWSYIEDYPITRIDGLPDKTWLDEETKDRLVDLGDKGYYDDFLKEDIREPIVLLDDGVRGYLWDGWHRSAATNVKEDQTIKALVGYPSKINSADFLFGPTRDTFPNL